MTSLWAYRLPCTVRHVPVMADVVRLVAARHRVPVEALLGRSRTAPVVTARQEAYWECRQHPHLSLPAIGRFFGRDHSTVLLGIRRHEARQA
jgi:chromosomal replication initiator protein